MTPFLIFSRLAIIGWICWSPLNATGWELVSYLQVNCVSLGCFLERAILTDILELFGYHLETDQLGGTEGR